MTKARLQEGEWVLIWGIGSGVATAGLAIAKALGAKSDRHLLQRRKLGRARELGADATVNHESGDVVAAVEEATGGRAPTSSSSTSARPPGSVARGGARGRPDRRLRGDHRAEPSGGAAPDLVEAAHDLRLDDGDAGRLRGGLRADRGGRAKPVVDSVLPLAEARAAHERMEAGEQFGKIVLTIP